MNEREVRLDDESRVRVLSPAMMVFKRFVRNRLAITGMAVLIAMFLFSFAGALVTPYSQSQVFYKYETMMKSFASLAPNEELRYTVAEGEQFSLGARAQFILALNNKKDSFTADGMDYTFATMTEDCYRIFFIEQVGGAMGLKGKYAYTGDGLTEAAIAAFEAAQAESQSEFTLDGVRYMVTKAGKGFAISRAKDTALASMNIFDAHDVGDQALVAGFPFRLAAETAIANGETAFEAAGRTFRLETEAESVAVYAGQNGAEIPFAMVTDFVVSALSPDVQITMAFKDAVLENVAANERRFVFPDPDGTEIHYEITGAGSTHTVKREMETLLIDAYAFPTAEHWLGTDQNGMDMLTRLVYGGRVSLLVGFVVVLMELLIGVIIGGVSGYFGGWLDTLLMRLIDLFNCVPSYPVLIIAGAVMDTLDVDPMVRIFLLMLVLGLLGWTSIGRTVRGQILTLREQDFMVATEATGLRVSRRIFRHLVPNVMPLLIVNATMSLGGIIITEATLSFLGLGLKYPMASWGTVINAATDVFVMTNFWFIWIPAGILILLTVLGFNFVGDGLRDAFDPRMKR